uniref:Uncharacterized protein n=1 Tax=Nicotiana tabacum TaxID=4097 RepID=A0A1S3Y3P5_TOBAC|nr:PREDICTED: uncharacterized protein LOC107771891 [Nicotiana tabacum]
MLRHKYATYDSLWCVIGDFNVIASVEEKMGGITYQMSKSIDFLDLGFYGPKCTWSNGIGQCSIVWKRLDRGLVNDQWLAAFSNTTVSHLASIGSDHNHLLMEINVRQDTDNKYFRFLILWVDNVNFKPYVKGIWDKQVNGSAMWIFHQKLKALCTGLSKWSRQEYGDIFQKAKEFEEQVKAAEMVLAQTNDESDRATLHDLEAQYIRYMKL